MIPKDKNIVLTGFMGCGKSSVGRYLALRLDRPLIDIDKEIENKAGQRIEEIFASQGEEKFRDLESEVIAEFSTRYPLVITTGGGAVLRVENVTALKQHGFLVCLQASAETIYHRVKNSTHRPLLRTDEDLLGKITSLMKQRVPFYEQADMTICTDNKTPSMVAEYISGLVSTE